MKTNQEERKVLRTDWKELPINKELSEILLQLTNARARLLNFLESISDRGEYEMYQQQYGRVGDKLSDVINTVGMDIMAMNTMCNLVED